MNITYKGKIREFTDLEQQKLDAKFARIAQLVDRKGERKAYVVVTTTRHLHKAEIQMNYEEHPLVGIASDPDFYQAICAAVDKLEKQTLKVREKMRDHRGPQIKIADRLDGVDAAAMPAAAKTAKKSLKKAAASGSIKMIEAPATAKRGAKVYRVANHRHSKPMTLDEAMLKMKSQHDYFAFVDSASGNVSVLIRRTDGHFDLVEG